jgi:hypothetical protein
MSRSHLFAEMSHIYPRRIVASASEETWSKTCWETPVGSLRYTSAPPRRVRDLMIAETSRSTREFEPTRALVARHHRFHMSKATAEHQKERTRPASGRLRRTWTIRLECSQGRLDAVEFAFHLRQQFGEPVEVAGLGSLLCLERDLAQGASR